MRVEAYKTPVFNESDSLADFLFEQLPLLGERSIVVITSKIVALAEGRTAPFTDEAAKEALIRSESDWVMETKYTWLTQKDGMIMASAGIDESNAAGKLVLLPKDSFVAADQLRKALMDHYGLHNLGVLITDSRIFPLRAGVTGVSLGYAGFKGIRDYRGTPDIFERPLEMTQTNVADALAAAAVLTMGEGNEQQPLALITEAPVTFVDQIERDELAIDIREDMYRPFFATLE